MELADRKPDSITLTITHLDGTTTKVTVLANGDSRKMLILKAWINGYNDSEIAKLLAKVCGGNSESHRKFMLDGENAGYWGDSGTGERGGFTALLARLRGESEAETAEYLRVEYGLDTAVITDKPAKLARLQRVLAPPKNTASLAVPAVEPSAYLAERGIPAEIQALYGLPALRLPTLQCLTISAYVGRAKLFAGTYTILLTRG